VGRTWQSDIVRACGYVSAKKDGSEAHLNFNSLYEQLLQRQECWNFWSGSKVGIGGRKAQLHHISKINLIKIKWQFAGRQGLHQLAWISSQGDEFEIKLGQQRQISLMSFFCAEEKRVSHK